MDLDVFSSCFVLTKLSSSGFSCLPLSVVLLIFSLRKPKEKQNGLLELYMFVWSGKMSFSSCCLAHFQDVQQLLCLSFR